ncbi:MAG TPA: ATP-binding protein [Burkholderiales bacterium]|nr:ATP-binding protein [Burkholderiales bacterium]
MSIRNDNLANIIYGKITKFSLMNVYYEAVANALDAGASRIKVNIYLKKPNATTIIDALEFIDNGVGFTQTNIDNYSEAAKPKDSNHKGLGRFASFMYFKKHHIDSQTGSKKVSFDFNHDFSLGVDNKIERDEVSEPLTKIRYFDFTGSKVHDKNFYSCDYITQKLMYEHYPKLFSLVDFEIVVTSYFCEKSGECVQTSSKSLTRANLFEFKEQLIPIQLDELNPTEFKLRYSINKNGKLGSDEPSSIISFVSVDNRTIEYHIVNVKSLPNGYDFILALESSYFDNKASKDRTEIINDLYHDVIADEVKRTIQKIMQKDYPEILTKNDQIRQNLQSRYPHLNGIFEFSAMEFDEKTIVSKAANLFMRQQLEILDKRNSSELTAEDYQKSQDLSSRVLLEYVLYRNFTINKIKDLIDKNELEKEIHNLIIPQYTKGSSQKISKFINNLWLFDDRFMSFDQVFSNEQIKTIFPQLSQHLVQPDILTITANSTDKTKINDIIIIELKRPDNDITPARAEEQLLEYADYTNDAFDKNKPRIWLYAFLDLTDNIRALELKQYNKIYVSGKNPICYKYFESVNAIINFLDYRSLVADAEQRNKTFIEIIQNGFNDTLSQISNIDKPTA